MEHSEQGSEFVELSAEEQREDEHFGQDLDAALTLRPRAAPQILDLACEVVMGRFLALVGVCTLIWIPLRVGMPWFVNVMDQMSSMAGPDSVTEVVISFLAMMGGSFLVTVLSMTTVTILVHGQLIGRPVPAMEALHRTLLRLPALIGLFILVAMILGAGLGVLTVLGLLCPPFLVVALAYYIFFSAKLSVAPAALILEDLGVRESMRRSWQLTKGSVLRWLGVMVLSTLLVSGFSGALQFGDTVEIRDPLIEALGLPRLVFHAVFVVISAVFSGVATAFSSAAMTVFYLDTRMRTGGFDLSLRLERQKGQHSPLASAD